jgi:hypothetical protein
MTKAKLPIGRATPWPGKWLALGAVIRLIVP